MHYKRLLRLISRSSTVRQAKRYARNWTGRGPHRVPADLGVTGLFTALKDHGCRYVVLRWFEDLPATTGRSDLDILIDDRDAEILAGFLTRSPRRGTIPCDIFSVSGVDTFSHRGLPYYPPAIASQILARAITHSSGASIPCLEDHFWSLAFHALYHEGHESGLRISQTKGPKSEAPKHDYSSVLISLANALSLTVPITMEALDLEMERRGWRPPPDTILKWATRNEFCREVATRMFDGTNAPPGLVVCVVRDAATADPDVIPTLTEMMKGWGFIHLATEPLNPDQKDRATRMIRGGNWGRGIFPRSGGSPFCLIVGLDPSPSTPPSDLRRRHPGLDNDRVVAFKAEVRQWWNARRPAGEACNIMHTSDNAAHALHYLQAVMPDAMEAILRQVGWEPSHTVGISSPIGPPDCFEPSSGGAATAAGAWGARQSSCR
jgi:hypothetical protein